MLTFGDFRRLRLQPAESGTIQLFHSKSRIRGDTEKQKAAWERKELLRRREAREATPTYSDAAIADFLSSYTRICGGSDAYDDGTPLTRGGAFYRLLLAAFLLPSPQIYPQVFHPKPDTLPASPPYSPEPDTCEDFPRCIRRRSGKADMDGGGVCEDQSSSRAPPRPHIFTMKEFYVGRAQFSARAVVTVDGERTA
ncbi:hypothetical protein ACLOJK_000551 [Asimina triloba]